MNKRKIVKSEFSFLKKHGFIMKYDHGNVMSTYTFINLDNSCIKIIISENYNEKYIDLKVRGQKHKILFFYEWDHLMANEKFAGAEDMVKGVREVYETIQRQQPSYFQSIIKLYSKAVKNNLNKILA